MKKRKKKNRITYIVMGLMVLLLLTSCSSEKDGNKVIEDIVVINDVEAMNELEDGENSKGVSLAEELEEIETEEIVDIEESKIVEETIEEKVDYEGLNVNEIGEIMVIMYHNLGETNTQYARTVESFKADMERLYNEGYRPISMNDFITNNISVEAGYTPFVLTFDDGHMTNFNMILNEETGEYDIDPDCVIGIFNEKNIKYPDFDLTAIFYLNQYAFGQADLIGEKITYLLDNGYEIGNHTTNHLDLSTAGSEELSKVLGANNQYYKNFDSRVEMESLALPFGKSPSSDELESVVRNGSYDGFEYENKLMLAVGWRPSVSSIDISYNPNYVMRVQSGDGEMQLGWWLDNYIDAPSSRYISDGNSETVVVPESKVENVNMDKLGDKELITW